MERRWNSSYFEKTKKKIIYLILDADQQLKSAEAKTGASVERSIEE